MKVIFIKKPLADKCGAFVSGFKLCENTFYMRKQTKAFSWNEFLKVTW